MRKRRDYKPGDQISRGEAWKDLKDDFVRIWKPGDRHVFTDIFVNIARIAGVSDRDDSQVVGRTLMILTLIAMLAGIGAWLG